MLIDHSTKAKDAPLHASGSKRKRAAITGASYLVNEIVPLTRDTGGRLALVCAKDRHGNYRRGETVTTFDLRPHEGALATVKLFVPTAADTSQRPALAALAAQVVEIVKTADAPPTQRALLELMGEAGITAADEKKKGAIEWAVSRGAIRIEAGPNRAHNHLFDHDLEPES